MGENEQILCTFSVFSIDIDKDNCLSKNQKFCMKKIEKISLDSTFNLFHLAWIANTLPEFQLEISQLAQVTEERFDNEKLYLIRYLKKLTQYAIDNNIVLRIPQLNKDYFRIDCFPDSYFANNYELYPAWPYFFSF